MNINEESDFLEIIAGIISREDNRNAYNIFDWVKAETLLKEGGFD